MGYNATFSVVCLLRKEARCTDTEQFPWGDGEWENKFFIPFALLNVFSKFGKPGRILCLEILRRQNCPALCQTLAFPTQPPLSAGLSHPPYGMFLVLTFFTDRKPVFPHSLHSQCRVDIFTCMSLSCLLNQCLQGPWSTSSNLLSSLSCLSHAVERLRTTHSQRCGL